MITALLAPLINSRHYATGTLKLSRKLGYYVIRIYSITFLLVSTTFVGFWLPTLAWPVRAIVVVTPLISLTTMQQTVSADLNVAYVVALHIWMAFCIFFVFMAFVEYACAVWFANVVEVVYFRLVNE